MDLSKLMLLAMAFVFIFSMCWLIYWICQFGLKRDKPILSWDNLRLVPTLLFAFSLVNFIVGDVFIWGCMLGGFASNGKFENGKYYIGNHGVYTEVSEAIFKTSLWYDRITSGFFWTSLLLLLVQAFRTKRKKKFAIIDTVETQKTNDTSNEVNTHANSP